MKDKLNPLHIPPALLLKVLRRARTILSRPNAWIKGDLAQDELEEPVSVDSRKACRFCTIGAIERATFDVTGTCDAALTCTAANLMRGDSPVSVVGWNDSKYRSVMDVLMAFDFGILAARDEAKAVA